MKRKRWTGWLWVMALATGCSGSGESEAGTTPGGDPGASATAAAPLSLATDPSSWRGTLPCADCDGIRTTLTLGADGVYRRSDAYLGTAADPASDTLFTRAGRWLREGPDGSVVALVANPAHGGRFQAVGGFGYFADAALFITCESGLQLPVAMEGAYLDLERTYAASGVPGPSPVVVVEDHAVTDGSCPVLELPGTLSDTWRLTHLDGESVEAGLPTPTLSRAPADGQISGSGGCNRFTGRGTLRGNLLVPGPLAVTRRFCEGVMDLEGRVLEVLGAGGWLRMEDGALVLRRGPDEVARFSLSQEQP